MSGRESPGWGHLLGQTMAPGATHQWLRGSDRLASGCGGSALETSKATGAGGPPTHRRTVGGAGGSSPRTDK